MNDPYAPIVDYYDMEHDGFTDDLELFLNLAHATGDPVLELGCGTGRIMRPLLAAGYRVTGLDSSSRMLERARLRLFDSEGALFHLGSMTQAHRVPGGPFGFVIIALNGLLHLSSQDEQRATLASARRALDPRGQLVVDVMNPSPRTLGTFDRSFQHGGTWLERSGDRVDKFIVQAEGDTSQTISTELWYDRTDTAGAVTRIATSYTLRYVHAAELALLLELAGFVDIQFYGGYNLEPFDTHADRLIVTAEATSTR
ncbi:MAG: class I SAM-dependent methyltransferase [Chloroflexota bacterium]|nr:class I SAM-dependent methyltransferase [Chloroflexota bacterium]